ncbi:MAG: sugar phosphate isomerase/epimerase [Corallococcus sp.]|nr:sugar phosphate isomerase/epimerase [Bacillota bacterium]MCM1533507.1 sugar phosphate isomerase/epimerase [Corallococcus sp.]
MKKGQNFRFGFYDVPPQERLAAIKKAGFDETMFWWGDEYEATDGTRFDLFDTALSLGLAVNTCHFPSTHAEFLWYDDERAEQYVKQFDEACRECGERGVKNLVVHLTRKLITPEPNEKGIVNFDKMLNSAKRHNVVIAIENTRFLRYNDYILQRFAPDENIGFCFDSGHANCYTPNELPLEKYGDMLVTTHIHDNMGPVGNEPDQHHLMGEGIVDFDKVFARLKHFDVKRINLESYCNATSKYLGKLNAEQFMELSYATLSKQMERSGIE